MRYLGGKSRIARNISDVINGEVTPNANNLTFVSLFCGSCSVESKVRGFNKVICNDSHVYLIEMLKAVQSGYELPEQISAEQYKYIREHKQEDVALTGFVGFGCSFGGKWFGGYAKNKTGTNYASQSKRSLLKDMANLKEAEFLCKDYRDVEIPDGSIVYSDPPYSNTTGYSNSKFNSDDFWNYMRELSKNNKVFVSEQSSPDDFNCIWEKPFTRTLDVNKKNQFVVTERLFTYRGDLYNLCTKK